MHRALLGLGLQLSFGVALAGCDDDGRECFPGDFIACTCEGGQPGYSQCDELGEAYRGCGFCGTTPGAAASTTGAGGQGGQGGQGGGLIPFMEPCEDSEQCETGLCHLFNAKGAFCSQPCESPSDCPSPSTGCNMMGICKAP